MGVVDSGGFESIVEQCLLSVVSEQRPIEKPARPFSFQQEGKGHKE